MVCLIARKFLFAWPLMLWLVGTACAEVDHRPPKRFSYEVVNTFPHDSKAFCQGLVCRGKWLFESTGQYGQSSLRRVELTTGRVEQKLALNRRLFAEGLTLFDGKLYQLTWRAKTGFIYDADTLKRVGKFKYEGEGWGLTHDGSHLILSDGTDRLRFLDPDSFRVTKTLRVKEGSKAIGWLNELEYINGKILANVWYSNQIAIIGPESGQVVGWIDLRGLSRHPLGRESVLNGIAYDEESGRLFVTGKNWPELYEIKIRRRESSD